MDVSSPAREPRPQQVFSIYSFLLMMNMVLAHLHCVGGFVDHIFNSKYHHNACSALEAHNIAF